MQTLQHHPTHPDLLPQLTAEGKPVVENRQEQTDWAFWTVTELPKKEQNICTQSATHTLTFSGQFSEAVAENFLSPSVQPSSSETVRNSIFFTAPQHAPALDLCPVLSLVTLETIHAHHKSELTDVPCPHVLHSSHNA